MLWGITSYFNPAEYKTRLTSYRTFKRNLRIPLVAVELSFNGRFELQDDDAEIVVRLIGRDVLWHKERLLNLALRALPPQCDAVAWLDCDVVFANQEWPQATETALQRFPIVQLFSERCMLGRDAVQNGSEWAPIELVVPSVGYAIATGTLKPDGLRVAGGFTSGDPTTGLAWAARRSLLDCHGIYDAHVLGAGDRAVACAAIGRFDSFTDAIVANRSQQRHYREWGDPFFADVAGGLGVIQGRIFHLWHGTTANRHYAQRHREFAQFGFDPYTDIAVAPNGCWQWNSDKPEMHRYILDYFAVRREDG